MWLYVQSTLQYKVMETVVRRIFACLIVLQLASATVAVANAADPRMAAMAAERSQAMAKLGYMRGTWVGTARGMAPDGTPFEVTQTERMGPMLGGDIVVIEGRGYDKAGAVAFNAFGIVSYNVFTKAYEMRSYAQGFAGTFPFQLTPQGFVWETPAGQGAIMRFTATIGNGTWHEVGERVVQGQPPVKTIELNLKRLGETDWPAGNPVLPPR